MILPLETVKRSSEVTNVGGSVDVKSKERKLMISQLLV